MAHYEEVFAHYGDMVAQGILTRGDISPCRSHLNVSKTLPALLPVDVPSALSEFGHSDTVPVLNTNGNELARGLTSYHASDMTKISGQRSREIESILGYAYREEVIHRDQLVLFARQEKRQ